MFCATFSETFLILRRIQRDIIYMYARLHVKYHLFLSDFNAGQIFEKYSNVRFHENPSNGSRVVPCGRTDRHDEPICHFSKFCECAK